MKQSIKKLLGMLMLLIIPVYFYSCSDDGGGEKKILLPKTEGFFVFGTNTIAEEPTDAAARMALAKLDPTKGPAAVDSVYGKYMYIGANSEIQFALVNEEDGILIGSSDAAATNGADAALSVDDDNVIIGTLEEGGDPIEVTAEGLYYVVADLNQMTLVITPVKPNLVGDALVDGTWTSSVSIPLKSISKDQVVFEAEEVRFVTGFGYKYRFNEGWASYYQPTFATFSFLGVESYGNSWDTKTINAGFYNDNIPSFAAGKYTVTMTFTPSLAGDGGVWTARAVTDMSEISMAIIGNAITGTSWNGDGTGGYQPKVPAKAGNVYTWTWNDVTVIQDMEFIFLQDATWGKMLVAAAGVTLNGTATTSDPAKIVDATTKGKPDHNFYVVTAGTYDITLVIDAATNATTVTVNNN